MDGMTINHIVSIDHGSYVPTDDSSSFLHMVLERAGAC